jgi:uncharacterized membrane protein YcjF (UPF0283 family)
MTTRSKITLVVLGVAFGIALIVFTRWMTFQRNWFFWVGVVASAMGILGLVFQGWREILKIRWLGLADRTETEATMRRKPSMTRPSAPATDAITQHVNPQIAADQKDRTDTITR